MRLKKKLSDPLSPTDFPFEFCVLSAVGPGARRAEALARHASHRISRWRTTFSTASFRPEYVNSKEAV